MGEWSGGHSCRVILFLCRDWREWGELNSLKKKKKKKKKIEEMTAGARVETPIDPRPATRIRGGRENGKNLRSLLLLAQQCWPLSPNSNRWVDNLLHHTFFLLFLLLYDSFAPDCPQGPQILNNSKQYEILHSIVSIYCLGVYQKSVQVLKENCWSIQSPLEHRNGSSRVQLHLLNGIFLSAPPLAVPPLACI